MPLNGTKTHPLTPAARATLARLASADLPRYQINPGLINRLMREKLVELVMVPKIFKHYVRSVPTLRITPAGRKVVA